MIVTSMVSANMVEGFESKIVEAEPWEQRKPDRQKTGRYDCAYDRRKEPGENESSGG
ncbi:MAG: hypothetical protein JO323_18010 [Acidobacteriia bacterium]|nr:hypothetical protein [Terriglobia bacterium]